jgi:hypothetical protein
MFTLPQTGEAEGSSSKRPLKLAGLTADAFRSFVSVAIPRCAVSTYLRSYWMQTLKWAHTSSIIPGQKLTLIEWGRVLHLSDMWQIDDLRHIVIAEMTAKFDEHSAVVQLQLADRFQIQQWVYPAVQHLVLRKTTLLRHELELLGFELAAKVLLIRDTNFANLLGQTTTHMTFASNKQIEKVFGCEVPSQPSWDSMFAPPDMD